MGVNQVQSALLKYELGGGRRGALCEGEIFRSHRAFADTGLQFLGRGRIAIVEGLFVCAERRLSVFSDPLEFVGTAAEEVVEARHRQGLLVILKPRWVGRRDGLVCNGHRISREGHRRLLESYPHEIIAEVTLFLPALALR